MYETNITTKSKKISLPEKFQRGQIETLLKLNLPKTQIARQAGISRSTLYLELKRGTTTQMNSDLTFREEYFADSGQNKYESNRKPCHRKSPLPIFQNGLNERFNGLIRRFIPKGSDTYKVTEETISEIQTYFNTLPRKILYWQTPKDFFPKRVHFFLHLTQTQFMTKNFKALIPRFVKQNF